MKIVVDGMGGDYAPREVVKGAVEVLEELIDVEIILTGDKQALENELAHYNKTSRISIFPTEEVITMHDHPKDALLKKKNSSLYKAIGLVKNKEAVGIVSAGNTGAQMAISLFVLGRLPKVSRPAIGVPLPYRDSTGLLIDGGANADVTLREYLVFALLGKVYLESILGRKVTIGLLNIGEEPEKGPQIVQDAYKMLKENFEEFKGNIEANEVLSHKVDVIVTGGFTGNMLLKAIEGAAETILDAFKEAANSSLKAKIGGLLLKDSLKSVMKTFDFETFGGSPLLGIDGISIIAHGRSRHCAIKNAIKVCYNIEKDKIIDRFKEQLNNESFGN
jgi:glycerol-3-phosphate acyltransferase PlsX